MILFTDLYGNTYQAQGSLVVYEYDTETGALISATNTEPSVTLVDDGSGNVTMTKTFQTFRIRFGQTQLETVSTWTDIKNKDGSGTVSDVPVQSDASKASIVRYIYDGTGLLIATRNTQAGAQVSRDIHGNLNTSRTTQIYRMSRFGQAQVIEVRTQTQVQNQDGSYSVDDHPLAQESILRYVYNSDGVLIQATQVQEGITVIDNGYGDLTLSKTEQTYIVTPDGQALVIQSENTTYSLGVDETGTYDNPGQQSDGTLSRSQNTTYYAYDADGNAVVEGGIYGAGTERDANEKYKTYGEGLSWSGRVGDTLPPTTATWDGTSDWTNNGNYSGTLNRVTQTYEQVDGEVKLKTTDTQTKTFSQTTTEYRYDTSDTEWIRSVKGELAGLSWEIDGQLMKWL